MMAMTMITTAIMTMMMTTTNDGERQSKIRIAIIAGVGRALARPALFLAGCHVVAVPHGRNRPLAGA
jgi:hypothetical protein